MYVLKIVLVKVKTETLIAMSNAKAVLKKMVNAQKTAELTVLDACNAEIHVDFNAGIKVKIKTSTAMLNAWIV